ncbi:MAG: hypothetical protein GF401_10225 [Chitinivibrionales bacterium]|nr:hypothetical protein [Chitinivibrionales bacterium]
MINLRLCMLICVIVFAAIAGPNENAKIYVDLDYQTPEIDSVAQLAGTSVGIAIRAGDVVNLDSYEFFLRFDPSVLFFSMGQAETIGYSNIFRKNSSDEFLFSCGLESGHTDLLTISNTLTGGIDSVAAPDGDGILALIMFDIVSMESCSLWLEGVRFCDYEGDVNCEVITRYTHGALDYDLTHAKRVYTEEAALYVKSIFQTRVFDVRGRAIGGRSIEIVKPAKGIYIQKIADQPSFGCLKIADFKKSR